MVFDVAQALGKYTFEIEDCYTLEQIILLSYLNRKDKMNQMMAQARILLQMGSKQT